MFIQNIDIQHFRNIHSAKLTLHPSINLFYGKNGAGKTSLLEAIHVLSTGKSFRTRLPAQFITLGQAACTLFGSVQKTDSDPGLPAIKVGIKRHKNGETEIRIAEENAATLAALAQIAPMQIVHSESLRFLEANSKVRRQFFDWILFHGDPTFFPLWQRFRRTLMQRNAALKALRDRMGDPLSIQMWDTKLFEMGEMLNAARQAFFREFQPFFMDALKKLIDTEEIAVDFYQGWNAEQSLSEAFQKHYSADVCMGFTHVGPHRSDLIFKVKGVSAKNVLSRGQNKRLVCAGILARSSFLKEKSGKSNIVLVDDLSAELDQAGIEAFIRGVQELNTQLVITSVDEGDFSGFWGPGEGAIYIVEEGRASPSSCHLLAAATD